MSSSDEQFDYEFDSGVEKSDDSDTGIRPEGKAYERVGFGGRVNIGSEGDKDRTLAEIQKRVTGSTQTPEEKFEYLVNAISMRLNDDSFFRIKLQSDDIDHIISYAPYIKKIQYINPLVFILGYYCTDAGVTMNKERIATVFKKLSEVEKDITVKQADVIRYCRYILKLSKKYNI